MVIEPLSVNFRAFKTRFRRTCFSLCLSEIIGRSLRWSSMLMLILSLFPFAWSMNISSISPIIFPMVNSSLLILKFPDSILA